MTPRERGLIVRQTLYEALESLRASGPRTDFGLDWQSYNILYYRYFKHHMQHRYVAARLSLSERSYYRAQRKAIGELRDALLSMKVNVQGNSTTTPNLDVR